VYTYLQSEEGIVGVYVFDNSVFDAWLNKKSESILSKVGGAESITNEEMLILILKA
jgi:hypothetical protein